MIGCVLTKPCGILKNLIQQKEQIGVCNILLLVVVYCFGFLFSKTASFTSDGENRFESIRQAELIRIDLHCRIVMKNFDSVPQLRRFIYVHHCAARSRHGSHSHQCRHSLLQRQLAALLQCGTAGHGFGGLVQQLQHQSPEHLVWIVGGILTEQ